MCDDCLHQQSARWNYSEYVRDLCCVCVFFQLPELLRVRGVRHELLVVLVYIYIYIYTAATYTLTLYNMHGIQQR